MSKFDSTVKFEKFRPKLKKNKSKPKDGYVQEKRREKMNGKWGE